MPPTFRPFGKLRRDGARLLLEQLRAQGKSGVKLIWADGAYRGRLVAWVREKLDALLEVVPRPARNKGFQALPRRWVVERTFAWLGKCRRLSKDYEALPETTGAWVYAAMTGLMLRRLARSSPF